MCVMSCGVLCCFALCGGFRPKAFGIFAERLLSASSFMTFETLTFLINNLTR